MAAWVTPDEKIQQHANNVLGMAKQQQEADTADLAAKRDAQLKELLFGKQEDIKQSNLAKNIATAEGLKQKHGNQNVKVGGGEESIDIGADPSAGMMLRQDMSQNRIDNQAHQRVISELKNNKELSTRIGQLAGLSNSLSIMQRAKMTPESIMEAQQSIRKNLGVGGNSSVGEREEDYLKSLGLNAERWREFLSGEPSNISKDNKIFQHIKELAEIERSNLEGQINNHFDVLSGGNAEMYARRPDLDRSKNLLLKSMSERIQNIKSAADAPQTQQMGMQPAVQSPQQQPQQPQQGGFSSSVDNKLRSLFGKQPVQSSSTQAPQPLQTFQQPPQPTVPTYTDAHEARRQELIKKYGNVAGQ